MKKIDKFLKIAAKTKETLTMKPFNGLGAYFSVIKDKQRYIQVVYSPIQNELTDEFVKNNYPNNSKFSAILDVYQQIHKDTIISPPFNLSFE